MTYSEPTDLSQQGFVDWLVEHCDGADSGACRSDRREARRVARRILHHVPRSGDLNELGSTGAEIHAELHRRLVGESHRVEDGLGFGPLTIVIIGALLNFLIQWWFSDKHTQRVATLAAVLRQ